MMSTGHPVQDQQNFVRFSKFFSSFLELSKNEFKNLIWTSKFTFSFRGHASLRRMKNCSDSVMINLLALIVVDCGFRPWSDKTND
jgi:hypothetical protein